MVVSFSLLASYLGKIYACKVKNNFSVVNPCVAVLNDKI